MTSFLSQNDMNKIFQVIDDLGISREAITVPLLPKGTGSVGPLDRGKIKIVIPADSLLDDWIPAMRKQLEEICQENPGIVETT